MANILDWHRRENKARLVRDPDDYQWHDAGFRPPDFSDLIIYQFHIGVFYAKNDAGQDIRPYRVCKILDVVDRIEYWADLGVNAVMPLPFQEYQGENSLGYNGTDLFSPEMDYAVAPADLVPYLARVNRLFAAKGIPPLTRCAPGPDQSIQDVHRSLSSVWDRGDRGRRLQSRRRRLRRPEHQVFDRQPQMTDDNSLYFTSDDHAGGRVFAFAKPEVRQFLIDNARSLLEEYHVDGFRYDQVTVIDEHGGWFFCQELTGTVHFLKSRAVQIAEYWRQWRSLEKRGPSAVRVGLRSGLQRRSPRPVAQGHRRSGDGGDTAVNLDKLRDALYLSYQDPGRWAVFQCVENHDLLDFNHTGSDRQPRVAALADPTNARSWYARSRAKVATGMVLTAPGVPMIFMGQEFLEDKYWTDWPGRPELLIWWDGLEGKDRHMADQHRFTRELMWLRRKHPALRGEGLNVFHVHNENRVIAIHRWLPGVGRDVIVVASLNERRFTITAIASAFPAAATGTKCSTATFTTNGSIRTCREIPAASRPTDRRGTACRPQRESRCQRTVFWCSRATREISEKRDPVNLDGVSRRHRFALKVPLTI